MARRLQTLALTGLLAFSQLAFSQPASAQVDVYRWVDGNGVVHFSDTRRDETDEHIQLQTLAPSDDQIDAHARLMEQQLELIALLEQSRQSRAQESLERRRQDVELARARLALEQERNAASYDYDDRYDRRGWGFAYPVQHSYRFDRRYGNRRWSGHGTSTGRPGHLPSYPPTHPGSRPGYGGGHGRPGHGVGRGHSRRTVSKPFITSR